MAEITPGSQTSEGKLAKVVAYFGMALTALSIVLPQLAAMFGELSAEFPHVAWLSLVGAALGTATTIIAKIALLVGRTSLKKEGVKADALVEAASVKAQALVAAPTTKEVP